MSSAIVVVALAVATIATAQDPLENHPGIPNYHRIRQDVAAAGQPSEDALRAIKDAGFKTVVNLRTEREGSLVEKAVVEALGLDYVNIPVGSDGISREQVELFSRILAESENRPVFVHCASSNRVGGMWFLHQVFAEGKDEAEALEEARKAGLGPALEERVKEYVKKNPK